jgi:hypothetical protein
MADEGGKEYAPRIELQVAASSVVSIALRNVNEVEYC